jgi:hypothetical protein
MSGDFLMPAFKINGLGERACGNIKGLLDR